MDLTDLDSDKVYLYFVSPNVLFPLLVVTIIYLTFIVRNSYQQSLILHTLNLKNTMFIDRYGLPVCLEFQFLTWLLLWSTNQNYILGILTSQNLNRLIFHIWSLKLIGIHTSSRKNRHPPINKSMFYRISACADT